MVETRASRSAVWVRAALTIPSVVVIGAAGGATISAGLFALLALVFLRGEDSTYVGTALVTAGAVGFLAAGLNPLVAVGTATLGTIVHALRLRARTRPTRRGVRPVVY